MASSDVSNHTMTPSPVVGTPLPAPEIDPRSEYQAIGRGADIDAVLGGLYQLIAPHLAKKQRRLLVGTAARAFSRDGGARMAKISGRSRPAVDTGTRVLDQPPNPRGRIRRPGDGPKRAVARLIGRPLGRNLDTERGIGFPSMSAAVI
jgi:hypothetical protein